MTVSGIVLAAGSGSRLGQPKADLVVDGVRLVDRAVHVLRAGGCDDVVVVSRLGATVTDAVMVVNPDPERGMGSSLALGLAAAPGDEAVIMLVDTPGINADAVRRVISVPADVVIATYGGHRGHPVRIARRWWADVTRLAEGDRGARAFLAAHPDLVVEVACNGDPVDLDTVADVVAWERRR